jgi:hypothetical protein
MEGASDLPALELGFTDLMMSFTNLGWCTCQEWFAVRGRGTPRAREGVAWAAGAGMASNSVIPSDVSALTRSSLVRLKRPEGMERCPTWACMAREMWMADGLGVLDDGMATRREKLKTKHASLRVPLHRPEESHLATRYTFGCLPRCSCHYRCPMVCKLA